MTKSELMDAQVDIEYKIKQWAEKNDLITPDIGPIPDGIYDAEKYLSSS